MTDRLLLDGVATRAPLTTGQQRLWLLDQVDPGSLEYHIPFAHRLRGPLDPQALCAALDDVVQRHGMLRTRFVVADGAPVQEVLDGWHCEVERIDLGGRPLPEREATALALAAERSTTPFDLAAAPPLRAALARLGDDDHLFCLVLHHILADDWSLTLLWSQLAEFYEARLAGRPADLPALPVRYTDHARGEADRPASERAASLEYWERTLSGAERLDLATDRPRPPELTTRGTFDGFDLGAQAAAGLRTLCRAGRTTPFMTLMAGYLALLHLYTGQDDISVGTPVSGRNNPEVENLIGFFLGTVVLRGDLSGDPTFRELLARVKTSMIEAFGHADVPAEDLMSRLGLRRDPSRTPFFDTMFIVHGSRTGPGLVLPGIDVDFTDPGHHFVKFDLTLECFHAPGVLTVDASYRTDLFDAETIALMVNRLGTLLRCAAEAPDLPLSALTRRLVAAESAAAESATPVARGACAPEASDGPGVVELLSAQARATPLAVAVHAGGDEVTYAELHRRAAAVAEALRARGVGRDDLVGVCLSAGLDQITALLAVIRAGAAYLPLDPAYPSRRLAYLIADSRVRLVVTTRSLLDDLPTDADTVDVLLLDDLPTDADTVDVLLLDDLPTDADTVDVLLLDDLPTDADVDDPAPDLDAAAYAIYTSGSTGQPKAAVITHGALAVRVRWMRDNYRITPADRVLQFSSASFDAFGEELYPCLSSGAALVVPPCSRAELPDFLATPVGQAVTVLDLPTSYWHELVADLDSISWPPGLRLLILGGEQIRLDSLARWFEAFEDRVEVFNTYGPTETTIIATAARLTPADAATRPTIGTPIAGTCVHVLDEHGDELPSGVPGELVIGGGGLAREYLFRPELTATRFISFCGHRHYRSGDRVRFRQDGSLDFLGRLDDQFKVSGHRVEAAEISAALTAHADIRHAVAALDAGGRLVAYLVPESTRKAPAPAQLREHLAELLPVAVHPQAFAVLDTLPLTPNGKIDRAALAAAPLLEDDRSAGFEEPSGMGERLVAEVWAEVLGRGGISRYDDFFDLGGHSLLAVRVSARLRAAAGVEVPLRTIFRNTTVAELAVALEELVIADLEALDDEEVDRLLETERS
jgi:amino acid adenylation domain-containing protein